MNSKETMIANYGNGMQTYNYRHPINRNRLEMFELLTMEDNRLIVNEGLRGNENMVSLGAKSKEHKPGLYKLLSQSWLT